MVMVLKIGFSVDGIGKDILIHRRQRSQGQVRSEGEKVSEIHWQSDFFEIDGLMLRVCLLDVHTGVARSTTVVCNTTEQVTSGIAEA